MKASSQNVELDHENSSTKKTYAVTNDENRKRFIKLWDNGTTTIKKVSYLSI